MIALSTRSRCDECDRCPASFEEDGVFLCDECVALGLASISNSISLSGENVTVASESSPGPSVVAVTANSELDAAITRVVSEWRGIPPFNISQTTFRVTQDNLSHAASSGNSKSSVAVSL